MKKFFSLIAAVLFAGSMMADNYVLVTDASTLADGDQIIITDVDAAAAISTLQKSNNRGVTTVALTDGVIVPSENVQIITLVAAEANFMLQVGEDAYLYAASNSSNHLKTANAETVGDNGKFAISITEGVASVIAQGTNSRNDLRYNPSASCFSCYASSTSVEAGLKIFKKEGGVTPPPADTYTVAGTPASIFGEEWNPALAANDMTLANGIYKWEKAELDLTVGDIEFKVVKNHSWDIAYPAQNYVLNIAEDGEYTLTITFDPATEAVAAEAVKNEPLADPTNCAEAREAALSVSANNELYKDGAVYSIDGYVTSIQTAYNSQYNNISFWIADAADGGNVIEAYRAACASAEDAPIVGDKVTVTGSLTKYNTTPEFAAGCTYVITEHATPVVPVNLGEKTIAEFLALANTVDTCVITGIVANIKTNTDGSYNKYGNFDLVDGEASVYVYGLLTAEGEAQKFQEMGIDEGDTLTVKAVYSLYNNNVQAKNAVFVAVQKAVVVEHTYTVAGGSDVLFGTTWDPANAANDMALVEGLYTWEKSELTLAAGNIEFKVCEDHAWTTAYPAQNYQLNIPEAGIYTVTITFNAETKEVAAVATKTGEAVVVPTVAMHGNFLGSWADTENFAIAQDNASASLTLTLAEGNYEFGMRIGGSGNWTANGANLTREANTTNLAEGSGNMHIAADVAGDYVFTYTYETQVLEVVYPDAPVVPDTIVIDIESGVEYTDYVELQGWWQFMAENDEYEISLSNVSTTQAAGVYTVADMDQDYTYIYIKATEETITFVDGEFTLTEAEDGSRTIEGVMTGSDGNIYNIKLVFVIPTAETTVNVEIPEWGIVDASEYYGFAGYIFYGETADKSIYVQLVIPGSNPLGTFTYDDLYAGGTGIEVAGDYQSIYSIDLTVTAGGTAGEERAFITADILCFDNTLYHVTTLVGEGVDNIDAAVKAIKSIVNGQVVIEKTGKTYNMNGAVIR